MNWSVKGDKFSEWIERNKSVHLVGVDDKMYFSYKKIKLTVNVGWLTELYKMVPKT